MDIGTSREGCSATTAARMIPNGANGSVDIWFRFEGSDVSRDGFGDAFAAGFLASAMFEGEQMTVDGPVSTRLLQNLDVAQAILSSWYDFLSPIDVSAAWAGKGQPAPAGSAGGVACCFSGGVDSWYSLLKHRHRISHLLLVRGFDIGLRNDTLWEQTRARAQAVARRLDKQLITCTTNLREVADKRHASWGRAYAGDFWGQCLHGSALASVALALPAGIVELIIPATHSYRQIKFWGSSPLLDPLWSNGRIAITHDGCEADRMEKVRAIAHSDVALESLRVCHNNTADYNCGRCEKCLRTMMALRICGALDRARTFPNGLSLAAVYRLIVPDHVLPRYEEIVVAARRCGDAELRKAAEAAMGRRLSMLHAVARLKRRLRGTAGGRALKSLIRRPGVSRPDRVGHIVGAGNSRS